LVVAAGGAAAESLACGAVATVSICTGLFDHFIVDPGKLDIVMAMPHGGFFVSADGNADAITDQVLLQLFSMFGKQEDGFEIAKSKPSSSRGGDSQDDLHSMVYRDCDMWPLGVGLSACTQGIFEILRRADGRRDLAVLQEVMPLAYNLYCLSSNAYNENNSLGRHFVTYHLKSGGQRCASWLLEQVKAVALGAAGDRCEDEELLRSLVRSTGVHDLARAYNRALMLA
jgi:hypothetical protein